MTTETKEKLTKAQNLLGDALDNFPKVCDADYRMTAHGLKLRILATISIGEVIDVQEAVVAVAQELVFNELETAIREELRMRS